MPFASYYRNNISLVSVNIFRCIFVRTNYVATMGNINRRKFVKMAAGAGLAQLAWPALIQQALAVKANNITRSIQDVKHIVILMQENRSFDHYFGTMKGVRGFGDRFPIPLESGQNAFFQSDGTKIVAPYRAHRQTSNAAFVHGTPHDFHDTQAAWNQGKYGYWPMFKSPYSMAYYTREEIPFQHALAESFTIMDAHHCSVATGTDPNRIVFWSGSNFDPQQRAAGINCNDENSEPVNLRCWIKGQWPSPGYTYQGNAFHWPTIPDVLEEAGISWRIYQDPNDNWTGAMNGCLAFESFRSAKPGSSIYKNGMSHWSLEDLANDVKNNTLPQVTWVLPSQLDSEHPGAPSSPYRGADFTHEVFAAITSNPEVWSKTVFFLTFDENDGLFDHLPAPAVPSYNADGTLAGKSTIDLAGMYFHNDPASGSKKDYLDKRDTISGNVRPWGMGPRVPLYVISPWSKGGWVNSQVADHTSVAQFIEQRFGVTVPAISPWHRAISSNLVSAFDFEHPNDPRLPVLPVTSNHNALDAASKRLPAAEPLPGTAALYQEQGTRFSRALPYRLYTRLQVPKDMENITLEFDNRGSAGAVYHVYDLLHLNRIPKRYSVEAGKQLTDSWEVKNDHGDYHLEVHGPNGYFHEFRGNVQQAIPEVTLEYEHGKGGLSVMLNNPHDINIDMVIESPVYSYGGPRKIMLNAKKKMRKQWLLSKSGNWYDFTIKGEAFVFRFAGRVETRLPGISDPAMANHLKT